MKLADDGAAGEARLPEAPDGAGEGHPRYQLDGTIHSPIRLSIMACLAKTDRSEFRVVRETVVIRAATLSKQVTLLEAAGLVEVTKGYVGKQPRTWLALTPAGRTALSRYLSALRAIVGDIEAPQPPDRRPRSDARPA
ncbi:transcriptional regulator [Kitasatospora sp. NPDC049258]|uniref:winged helix-turn-helix domain-containing protein n=1 Tax=Kitasatospora sp. NPDC049258 TaxID=3155394 RepID=UPI00342D1002